MPDSRRIPLVLGAGNAPEGLRTPLKSKGKTAIPETGGAKDGALRGVSDAKPAPATPADPHLAALIDALAELPKGDRKAVAEHVAALAKLSPGKRAAILTLTQE